jgi:hypothetical protein
LARRCPISKSSSKIVHKLKLRDFVKKTSPTNLLKTFLFLCPPKLTSIVDRKRGKYEPLSHTAAGFVGYLLGSLLLDYSIKEPSTSSMSPRFYGWIG